MPGKPRSELHDRLLVHVVALDLAGDPALVQHQDAVADADQFRQFRRNRDDADALVGEVAQDRVDLRLGADVDAARRLVDEEHRGLTASSFASATFCWLPPESVDTGWWTLAQRMPSRSRIFSASAVSCPLRDHEAARDALQVERGDILGDRQVEEDAVALAILAEIDDPLADRGEIVALRRSPCRRDRSSRAALRQAADRLHRLGAARADQPAEAHDLAGSHFEADIVDDAAVRKPDHLQHRARPHAFSPRGG